MLTGARRPKETNKGYFFEPTVFEDVPDDARIMREEPFGPLAPVNTFRDVDDAIERANDTEYGLAAYVFTRSLGRAQHLSREIRAGMVGINTFLVAHAEAPFGGVKHSGMGREGGRAGDPRLSRREAQPLHGRLVAKAIQQSSARRFQ